jgi:hypothetical protein
MVTMQSSAEPRIAALGRGRVREERGAGEGVEAVAIRVVGAGDRGDRAGRDGEERIAERLRDAHLGDERHEAAEGDQRHRDLRPPAPGEQHEQARQQTHLRRRDPLHLAADGCRVAGEADAEESAEHDGDDDRVPSEALAAHGPERDPLARTSAA